MMAPTGETTFMAVVIGTSDSETLNSFDGVTSGADSIYGLGGNDVIVGGNGADYIHGGSGTDTASYSDSWEGVAVSLADGIGYAGAPDRDSAGGTGAGDTLVYIENLTGSAHADYLVGDDGNNVLTGLEGDDVLLGGGGADTFNGGSGLDWVFYDGSDEGVVVRLIADDAAGGDAEGDDLNSIENVVGSRHDDMLWGDDGANVLFGDDSNDILKGFGGNDTIEGSDDNDTLEGGDGKDSLDGGSGLDSLLGGAQADSFVWSNAGDTGLTAATADIVHDFDRQEGDRIRLNGIDANVYAAGNQAFAFIGTAAFSGTPGEIRYYHDGGDTYIEMQTGTSVDIEGLIVLSGIHTPTASWFVL
jgi:Ca2+-binding RTX toxin-like protein